MKIFNPHVGGRGFVLRHITHKSQNPLRGLPCQSCDCHLFQHIQIANYKTYPTIVRTKSVLK
jgi:hypothetical protein